MQGKTMQGKSMHLAVAADHGGFMLKEQLLAALRAAGHTVQDFGAFRLDSTDDYPDFVTPMAVAVASGEMERGLAICGSGVGACIVANKVRGVRAALIVDPYSARQGVEDDAMNVICLGGQVTGYALAWELVQTFLAARFRNDRRYLRRLKKIEELEAK